MNQIGNNCLVMRYSQQSIQDGKKINIQTAQNYVNK